MSENGAEKPEPTSMVEEKSLDLTTKTDEGDRKRKIDENVDSKEQEDIKKQKTDKNKPEYWVERWSDGQIGWHKQDVNSNLEKYVDKMINGRSAVKVFVPLCGKTVDMKWLYDKGHTIIGTDLADQAFQEFFTENNIKYTTEEIKEPKMTLYQSEDKRIRLYAGNIYDFTSELESDVEAVWDRGALVAINKEDRERYRNKLQELMSSEVRYLLVIVDYDETVHSGPPYYVPEDQVKQLYGDKYNVELLERKDSLDERSKTVWKLNKMDELIFLITPK